LIIILKTNFFSFYIVGVVWNTMVAVVIFFTYLETKGLTLEQIDQRFNGVPRDQIVEVVEAFDGGKPISETELHDKHVGQPAEQVTETPVSKA
jgi:hypothetical protein